LWNSSSSSSFSAKRSGLEQVLQAQRAARDLVLVGRADAAAGGADFLRALRMLARLVERRVIGQDQRAGFRNDEPRHDVLHAGLLELVHFRKQGLRRKHHAVADVAVDVAAQDARGNEVQHRLLAADHQVWPALWPPWKRTTALRAVGQPVDDLALALVAPLGADDDDVAGCFHFFFFLIFIAEARLRSSIEKPVAARGRPKALPTSS
jgi:hypothetical protein